MPRRDGTGPDGKGPRTGRGLGPCGKNKDTRSGQPSGPRRDGTGRQRRSRSGGK